jgi:predicted anti-sigma-YlaC factor YlaD
MTGHLTPEQLLDVADGTQARSAFPHLAECTACRGELEALARTIAAVHVDVPEPSPLFWDHFASRVRESIAREREPRPVWFRPLAAALGAFAVLVLVVSWARLQPAPGAVAPRDVAVIQAPSTGREINQAIEDESLDFVADLAGDLDWETVAEAGLTAGHGTADRVLLDLSTEESAELERLLHEALGAAPTTSGV